MKCEVDYCVYNRKSECTLDKIEIDQLGMCDSCEIVTIPKEELEKYKEKRLKQIKEIWEKYDKRKLL